MWLCLAVCPDIEERMQTSGKFKPDLRSWGFFFFFPLLPIFGLVFPGSTVNRFVCVFLPSQGSGVGHPYFSCVSAGVDALGGELGLGCFSVH